MRWCRMRLWRASECSRWTKSMRSCLNESLILHNSNVFLQFLLLFLQLLSLLLMSLPSYCYFQLFLIQTLRCLTQDALLVLKVLLVPLQHHLLVCEEALVLFNPRPQSILLCFCDRPKSWIRLAYFFRSLHCVLLHYRLKQNILLCVC